MGWKCFYRDTLEMKEEGQMNPEGRPMKDGQAGKLLCIAQEDYHHKIAVDLDRGLFIIDYDEIFVNDDKILEVKGAKAYINICEETSIVGDLQDLIQGQPDEEGWFEQHFEPLKWRPIWFYRHIIVPSGEIIVPCIGAQTTLPALYSTTKRRKNIKKYISLFPDGRMGIY